MLFLVLHLPTVLSSALPHHGPPHDHGDTRLLVGDDPDIGNIQMVRLGEDSSAPLYFRSEERRPGGYNYYNRIYHSDGSDLEQASSVYPSNHILNQARDQFSGQPDVNQYYHFDDQHSEKESGRDKHTEREYHESSGDTPSYYSTQGQQAEREYLDSSEDTPSYYSTQGQHTQREYLESGQDTQSYYSTHDKHTERDYHESSQDTPSYYSRQDEASHQTYGKSGTRYQDSFTDHHIEYSDLDLADDYEDYGMEIEFEKELNRIEHGDGLRYEETGGEIVSRDNAQVYVSDHFVNRNSHRENHAEVDYDIGYYNY